MTPLHTIPNVLPYLDAFAEGSDLYAQAHGTKPERVDLLAGVCLRETWGGKAPGYRPQGPSGTGDWVARTGHWLTRSGVRVVLDLPDGWQAPHRHGQLVPGPYAIPLDGLGWGRYLLQLDALGDQRDLIMPAPMPVERQAAAACAQIAKARQELAAYEAHPLYLAAVVARYNTSLDNVRAGIDAGNVDIATTGGDYSRDVFALRDALRRAYPERFP